MLPDDEIEVEIESDLLTWIHQTVEHARATRERSRLVVQGARRACERARLARLRRIAEPVEIPPVLLALLAESRRTR